MDIEDREVSPIIHASLLDPSASSPSQGVSGLAVDRQGRILASVDDSGSPDVQHASDLPHTSTLLIRDFPSGHVISGEPIRLAGAAIGIADLAFDHRSNQLLGITSQNSPGAGPGRLVVIDPDSGTASLIGSSGLSGNISIAITSTGALYATSQTDGFSPLRLHELEPASGSVISTTNVTDSQPVALTTGLTADPNSGLLFASESHSGRLFTIDPELATRERLDTQSPQRGVTGDLAFYSRLQSDEVQQLLHADFETGRDGFTIDNTGGEITGLWHHSIGRQLDGKLNHSPDHSFYYGAFEGATGNGHYVLGRHHRGVISSPQVDLPAEGTSILSFSYLLDTRPELTRDFVTVSIDDGTTVTQVLSRADGTLPETMSDWITATVDLSAYAGKTVSVDFEFDSGDPVRVDPEGWYVDDVVIVHLDDPAPLTADLSVVKTADNDTPTVGEQVTFELLVANSASSNAIATGVTLTDVLPTGLTFVSASGMHTPQAPSPTDPITWTLPDIEIGGTQIITVIAQVDADTASEPLTNLAEVSGRETDPNENNNQSSKTLTPELPPSADLSIKKTASNPTPIEGTQFTYTIVASNDASSVNAATGVTVVDVLPSGVTFVSVTPNDGSFDTSTGVWTIGDLSQGESKELAITATVNGDTAGSTVSNTAVIEGDQGDPDESNNTDTESITPQPIPAQAVQFIAPLSVFRQGDSEVPDLITMPITPKPGTGAVTGFAWADIDLQGDWDTNEKPRSGFQIFLDLDGNGSLDPETEPSTATDANGRYVFNDLAAGDYAIREVGLRRDTRFINTFPARSVHTVTVTADSVVSGDALEADPLNFGGFEYGLYVRPADQFERFVDDTELPLLEPSLMPWQSVTIRNTTNQTFQIEEVSKAKLAEESRPFVRVRQVNGSDDHRSLNEPISLPISVAPGKSAQFLVFYDPAKRSEVGDQVFEQRPDWLGQQPRAGVHTFAPNEQLEWIADTQLRFPVNLIGGSTFDSDVTHDGIVDNTDYFLLDDLLSQEPVIVKGESSLFDPTADVNARCPNGAEQVTNACIFPVGPKPHRELSLGDFGPLNVELEPRSMRAAIPNAMPRAALNLPATFPPDSLQSPSGEPIASVLSEDSRILAIDEVFASLN